MSALSFTGLLAMGALLLGALAGLGIILYRRRHPEQGGLLRLHIAGS